ncbi:MAG: PTS sugar transporter subunit IIA [Pseudomonadota bacterium]
MAIDLSDLLDRGVTLIENSCSSRKTSILRLSGAMADKLDLDERQVFEAVMQREQLGSTGVGEGVAIPHARMRGLEAPVGSLMRLSEPVEFDAVDERPCDLIFMLLAPDSAGADHLRALAQVSRALRRADIRDALRKADSAEGLRQVLCRSNAVSSSAA